MADVINFVGKAVVYEEGGQKKIYIQLESEHFVKLDESLVDHIPKIRDAKPAQCRSEALRILIHSAD